MTILEITIQRRSGDTWPVVLERSQAGELPLRVEGELALDARWPEQLLALALDSLAYGTVLGKALFRETIRDAFVTARNESRNDLRTLLVVEDADLKPLHWERVCGPIGSSGTWYPLGMDQRSIFSLYLPSLVDRRFPAIGRRDLRALALVANPPNGNRYRLQRFDETATVSGIHAAFGDLPHDLLAGTADATGQPTLNELVTCITGGRYTLLHIVAHGSYDDASGETTIYLLDDSGQVAPVAASRLVKRLDSVEGNLGLPRLVFLATCDSAAPEGERAGALGGLAQRLVRDLGLPAALAMTQRVSVATAVALARGFYARLREHGEADRALVQAAAGLAEACDISAPALYSRLAGRPLFSDTLDRELTESEMAFGLSRLETLLPERAPVLQEEFARQAERLRGLLDVGGDRGPLSKAAQEEWRQAEQSLNATSEEALDLSFPALALGKEPPSYDGRCPFPGLLAFGVRFANSRKPEDDDRRFFFGREHWVKELVAKLKSHPFLAVVGGSGTGKSSLVLAGLVPALEKAYPGLRTAYITPGNDPPSRLEAALASGKSNARSEREGSFLLPSVDSVPSILVVDQFEELFRLAKDRSGIQEFVNRLMELARRRFVVLTMRADFWGDCAPYAVLRDAMLAHQVLVPPMTSAELRSAMEQQAAAVGLRFEADLSNTILDAVEGEPGAMPLLQHLLLEMWKRRHGRWLRASEYRTLGGIQKAIAHTADGIYAALLADEQRIVRNIFVRLTRLGEEVIPGQERRDTRRRVPLLELVPASHDPIPVRDIVHRLADARLLAISSGEEIEVAHEALIRSWPRLRDWLNADSDRLRSLEGIRSAALEWHKRDQSEEFLIHGEETLVELRPFLDQSGVALNELEQCYVDACIELTHSTYTLLSIHVSRYSVEAEIDDGSRFLGGRLQLVDNVEKAVLLDPETYSRQLFDVLFTGPILEAYASAMGVAEKQTEGRLRIRLWTDPDAAAHALRWERLCGYQLSSILFSRNVPLPIPAPEPIRGHPLRLLFAVASPNNLADFALNPIDVETEVRNFRKAIGECQQGNRITVSVMPGQSALSAVTRADLKDAGYRVLDGITSLDNLLGSVADHHMVHLLTHGSQLHDGSSVLFLERDTGQVRGVTGVELATGLSALPRVPSLFTLVTSGSGWDMVNGLLRARVPAIVGFQDKLSMETAQLFTQDFYRHLLEHGTIDLAIHQTRLELLAQGRPDWDTLFLFMRTKSGRLFLARPRGLSSTRGGR